MNTSTLTTDPLFAATMQSPIGALDVTVDAAGRLLRIDMLADAAENAAGSDDVEPPLANATRGPLGAARCEPVFQQLDEYFAGKRQQFDLDLLPHGTDFQLQVWQVLRTIPFGSTISYAEQAQRLDRPNAARAVGAANGRNPLPIVVPCHRVVGKNGALVGFAGGVPKKQWLLAHEAAVCAGAAPAAP